MSVTSSSAVCVSMFVQVCVNICVGTCSQKVVGCNSQRKSERVVGLGKRCQFQNVTAFRFHFGHYLCTWSITPKRKSSRSNCHRFGHRVIVLGALVLNPSLVFHHRALSRRTLLTCSILRCSRLQDRSQNFSCASSQMIKLQIREN